jgi:hypothetical protein
MTKFSCKIGDFASSVVVLKDGRAMEVRRGKTTSFYGDVKRQFWPTVDDWKATLPEGAAIKEEGRPTPADKWATTNPVLARVIERAQAIRGYRILTSNCGCIGTREGLIREEIARYDGILNPKGAPIYSESTVKIYRSYLEDAEKRLADLLASGKGSERVYTTILSPRFFTLTDSGEMVAVYYSIRENVIMTRTEVLEGLRYRFSWHPFTNPEAPMWFLACPSCMIKI